MADNDTFLRRHPVTTYFVLAFGISWAWVLAVILPTGIPGQPDAMARLFGPAFIGMALGPVVAGLSLTMLLDGRPGLRALWRSMTTWRVPVRYYAIALLLVPACALLVLGTLTLVSPDFSPTVFGPNGGWATVAAGLTAGLAAGYLEEIGWTGFATRRLLNTRSILLIGVVVGILHGCWHFLVGYWGEGLVYGLWYFPYFVSFWVVGLTGLRILIVWLYTHTQSTLIAQLAHASYTGSMMIFWPAAASPAQTAIWTAPFALVLLTVALLIAVYMRSVPENPVAARP